MKRGKYLSIEVKEETVVGGGDRYGMSLSVMDRTSQRGLGDRPWGVDYPSHLTVDSPIRTEDEEDNTYYDDEHNHGEESHDIGIAVLGQSLPFLSTSLSREHPHEEDGECPEDLSWPIHSVIHIEGALLLRCRERILPRVEE